MKDPNPDHEECQIDVDSIKVCHFLSKSHPVPEDGAICSTDGPAAIKQILDYDIHARYMDI